MLGNMGLGWGGWGKIQVNDEGGCGCGRDWVWRGQGGGVCCLLEVLEGCTCQVNSLLRRPSKTTQPLVRTDRPKPPSKLSAWRSFLDDFELDHGIIVVFIRVGGVYKSNYNLKTNRQNWINVLLEYN